MKLNDMNEREPKDRVLFQRRDDNVFLGRHRDAAVEVGRREPGRREEGGGCRRVMTIEI